MIKYINSVSGEELPLVNLTCALDAFEEIYFNPPQGYDSFVLNHLSRVSILDLEKTEVIKDFRHEDCFYARIDNYIVLGRVFDNEMYLVRTMNKGRVFYINTLDKFADVTKNTYYRLRPEVFRIWMDLFMNESLSKITWGI